MVILKKLETNDVFELFANHYIGFWGNSVKLRFILFLMNNVLNEISKIREYDTESGI